MTANDHHNHDGQPDSIHREHCPPVFLQIYIAELVIRRRDLLIGFHMTKLLNNGLTEVCHRLQMKREKESFRLLGNVPVYSVPMYLTASAQTGVRRGHPENRCEGLPVHHPRYTVFCSACPVKKDTECQPTSVFDPAEPVPKGFPCIPHYPGIGARQPDRFSPRRPVQGPHRPQASWQIQEASTEVLCGFHSESLYMCEFLLSQEPALPDGVLQDVRTDEFCTAWH